MISAGLDMKTAPVWFDWSALEWKMNSLVVLFSVMRMKNRLYPVLCTCLAGGLEGAARA